MHVDCASGYRALFAGDQGRQHAVRVRQIPIDPRTGNLVEGGIQPQTHQVFKNIGEILKAAGASFDDVVTASVFVADMNDFAKVNDVYATYFSSPAPARATVQVGRLPKDCLVEIQVTAVLA